MRPLAALPFARIALALPSIALAKTITITPADDWTNIQAALPGDVVEIDPRPRMHVARPRGRAPTPRYSPITVTTIVRRWAAVRCSHR